MPFCPSLEAQTSAHKEKAHLNGGLSGGKKRSRANARKAPELFLVAGEFRGADMSKSRGVLENQNLWVICLFSVSYGGVKAAT
jgi:hypothetical protein